MQYDLIVVGAGHAGCEAALAAARLGAVTLLLTISPDTIAAMSCNPAIGGPAAKSHLVRELDALGGIMGKIIDRSYLNIRTINETRGPAVAALRAQADKKQYQAEMSLTLSNQANLHLKQGLVTELLVENGRAVGVELKSGRKYYAKATIIACGTFLGGQIVMGEIKYPGGRQGEPAAVELSESLKRAGLKLRRFQTATPPRVSRYSVDFQELTEQPLQEAQWGFSWDGLPEKRPQQPCWLTKTTQATIEYIVANLHRSPIKNGAITGKGPHFCPSIDRKALKFPDKVDHLIFLEPEGIYSGELYLLGLTTAMPEEVQEQILSTIPGLRKAEIVRPGYAVEYDCLESFQFTASLESKKIQNLFTAGQINGTSGYEEAAVQGLIAGINAARKIFGQAPLILNRTDSYIGILIDDLATRGTEEPYRMLTSLAEFRIFLRLDNALARLGEIGRRHGLVDDQSWEIRKNLLALMDHLRNFYNDTKVRADSPLWKSMGCAGPERGFRLRDVILRPELTEAVLLANYPGLNNYPLPVRQAVWNELKLAGYQKRQERQIEIIRELEEIILPEAINYHNLAGISSRAVIALEEVKPHSLGQALRIDGLTESDRAWLLLYFNAKGKEIINAKSS